MWALWWQGGKRRLLTSRCPCRGRLGTLKTPSCPWRGCPAAGQNLETGHLSRHYIAEISLNVTLNHNQHWFAHSCICNYFCKNVSSASFCVLSFRNKELWKQNVPNVQRLRTYMYPEFSDLVFTAPVIFGIVKCKMFLIVINCWNCSHFHVLLFYQISSL